MKMAKTLCKILISLWIVFNIATMLIEPNISSYLGRLTYRWITPYANTVGLNSSWNFFSPDPAHTMYVAYRVYFSDDFGNETKEPVLGYMPREKNQKILNPIRRRDMYAMRFFAIEPKRFRTLLGPWLCRQNPEASTIEMEHVVETVPLLDQITIGKVQSVRDFSQELQVSKARFDCKAVADEELL